VRPGSRTFEGLLAILWRVVRTSLCVKCGRVADRPLGSANHSGEIADDQKQLDVQDPEIRGSFRSTTV